MPIRNILVALDGSPASSVALEAAVAMHRAYDAHLTGLVTVADRVDLAEAGNTWIPPAILKTIRKATGKAMQGVEDDFAARTRGLPPDKLHLIERARGSDTTVAQASRFFDVAVVGIPDAGRGRPASALHPDRIALLSGRPVLAFPAGYKVDGVASRAVVAWDGSRAAARALNSAIRILETKDTVFVVTVGDPPRTRVDASGLDPETALKRQGLDAKWLHVPMQESIAATLLRQAAEHGADLLVMGAYEHSKFREDLFGGVTHQVMEDTGIPVFLAH